MSSRRLLLLSNSQLHGQESFEWCGEHIKTFFGKSKVNKVLFIPYAIKDYDGYVQKVRSAFQKLGLSIESIHEKPDPVAAVKNCDGLLIGGGNTFLLLKTLYEIKLIEPIRHRVLIEGLPYMGASAGTNVATKSINTTNDMPICYPPSFDALHLIPFNINPHFVDADPDSKHMGETRELRIKEYLEQPTCSSVLWHQSIHHLLALQSVVKRPHWLLKQLFLMLALVETLFSGFGLKEGCGLLVEGMKATLFGLASAKLFKKGQNPICYEPESDLSCLLNEKCQ